MATTIGSLDLNALNDLYSDSTQYFWFESDSTVTYGAGVHITLSPSATFMSNPTGQNILINTDGISIRNGLLPMMTLDNNSLDFNTVDIADGTYNTVATFSTTGAIIGLSSQTQTIISNNRFRIKSPSRTFVDIAPNSFSLSRINGNANSFYYHAANYIDDTFQLNPFMAFQQTVTNSGEEIGLIPRIFDVNLTSGQTITLDVEPEFSSGILVHVGTIDAPADELRIMGAYDSNGNALSRDGITASLNTNTGKITFTISSSYSGTINKVLCAVGVHAQYPSFICGGVHDYDKWDYSLAENNNQFVYWSNVIGWTAYPFVVGIGDNRYHTSESVFNKKNGFSVDWDGNGVFAGGLTLNETNKLTDYIIETGSSGIWQWAKYASGRIECWGEKSWSDVACTTSAGGGYRSGDQSQALPSGLFSTIQSCQATMKDSGGSGYTMSLRTLCTTTTISQMFWNTTNATKSTCTVDYYIIGT